MKPAERTNSKSTAVFLAIYSAALIPLFIAASMLAVPIPGAAAPKSGSAPLAKSDRPVSPLVSSSQSSTAKSASPANSASYSGIAAHQTTGWGVYDTKACPAGIRIQVQTGTVLVAAPPDWTVYMFRKGQKKAAKMTYEMFRTKNRFSVKLSQIRERPRTIRVAGHKAVSYSFDVNKRLDETTGLGSLYRSRQTQPIVLRKEVVFAPDTDFIPKQAKEIWRSYFESPVVEEIPLETILYLQGGEKRVHMETITFTRAVMTAADFAVPKGLNYTAQFVEMIYGKEMEGVADLLLDP